MIAPGLDPDTYAHRARLRSRRGRAAIVSACALFILGSMAACDSATQRAEARPDARHGTASSAAAVAATDTQHVVINVKGMYCASCESTVTAMLRRTPGVLCANVSVDNGEATVVYDSARTSPAKLVNVITALGYTASVRGT